MMAEAISASESLRVFLIVIAFILGMVPGAWAAYRGLKALAYYIKLKLMGDLS
jgi:ABC-type dipeptide/oligopeptide/nickel transport system permease component